MGTRKPSKNRIETSEANKLAQAPVETRNQDGRSEECFEGQLSQSDEDALKEFCDGIEIEEIDFEDWKNIHQSLDLFVTTKISLIDSKTSGSLKVDYLQTTFEIIPNEPEKLTKKKAHSIIRWKSKIEDGHCFLVKGAGDKREKSLGDLTVTIKIIR